MKRSLVIGLAALTLAACVTKPITPPAADVPVAQTVTAIDASYNIVAEAYLGAPPSALRAQAKPILLKAYQAVLAADDAERLGDATSITTQINLASSLLAQARALLASH